MYAIIRKIAKQVVTEAAEAHPAEESRLLLRQFAKLDRLYNEALAQSATLAPISKNIRVDRVNKADVVDNKKSAPNNKEAEKNTTKEKLVFAGQNSSSNESDSVKEQLKKHSKTLSEMDVVERVNYNVTTRGKARSDAGEIFKRIGYKIDRQGFGIIEIGENQLSESAKYLNTPAEFAAWMSIPNVLKRGIIISGHNDHKSRGFSSVTIAAPVTINGKRGNVAVVVQQKGKNKYHVHRILMPDGSKFVYENIQQNAEPTFDSIAKEHSRKRLSISSTSNDSIHQNEPIVNTSNKKSEKYSIADETSTPDIMKTSLFSDRDVELSKARAHLTRNRVYSKSEVLRSINDTAKEQLSDLLGYDVSRVGFDLEKLEEIASAIAVRFNEETADNSKLEFCRRAAETLATFLIPTVVQTDRNYREFLRICGAKRSESEAAKNTVKALYNKVLTVFSLVETIGIEPMTPCMSSMYSNQLSYASITNG